MLRYLSVPTLTMTLALAATLPACNTSSSKHDDTGAKPTSASLPPLEVKDDSADLLLTWVDDKGDFHVVQKVADVPEGGRGQVRVVSTKKKAGHGRLVYVADLRKKKADGTYSVTTMARVAWDEIGAAKRKKRMEALAPPSASASTSSAPSAVAEAPTAAPSPHGSPPPPSAKALKPVTAIIYGAEWCGPCHSAERYLKSQGVTVVMKDIDNSEVAKAEMRRKLQRVGMASASIPIIDVAGRLLVGFNPSALNRAVAAARNAKKL